ncbi:hypothetical protein DFO55_1461, partial [Grimontella sp. AG753]
MAGNRLSCCASSHGAAPRVSPLSGFHP